MLVGGCGSSTLILAGERSPPEVIARWSEGRRLINVYGPTEATVCATMSEALSGAVEAPIGRPIWNTQVVCAGREFAAGAGWGFGGAVYRRAAGLRGVICTAAD